MSVSVVIPTYKRPATLLRTLQSLQRQTLGGFEIHVVDNAADAEVERLVVDFNSAAKVPACYVPEPQPGATFARHAGARASTGDLLVFVDDDVRLTPGVIEAYTNAFAKHPDMVAAGGPIRIDWEQPPPAWLVRYIGAAKCFPMLGLFEPFDEFRLAPDLVFFGANVAIRRAAFFEVGGFNPDLVGEVYGGDGEVGLYRKLQQRQMLVGYVPTALVYHHVPAERVSVDFLRRRMANEGIADMYSLYHPDMPGRLRLLRHAAGIAMRNSRAWAIGWLRRGRTDRTSVQIQLDGARTQSQLKYVVRLIVDKDLRTLVQKRDWLNA